MKSVAVLVLFLVAAFGAAAFGALFPPGSWYEQLVKPPWTPPNWVFAPVWTLLYVLMGVSGWLVWRRAGFSAAPAAFSAFALQLVLNGTWSWLFFGLHRPGIAFGEILLLWMAILVTIFLFWKKTWLAGAILLPYLVWVSFAAVLNWKLWQLNG
ncbi:TspO/MBR family protein [Nitrosococcus halophilus Nc 4]|uniref:TspO/MBR family protein n=1 Tax=Nitrosococcus halophilus (strain Nc4) TaxID=472759 RepID=D5BZ79_NITHN|nr:TspO/MBR family protein [Nitrosococcus halophilus]ADE16093.1 TspO/MBR family protein [Nitrosococcus halophilus Nc 4]